MPNHAVRPVAGGGAESSAGSSESSSILPGVLSRAEPRALAPSQQQPAPRLSAISPMSRPCDARRFAPNRLASVSQAPENAQGYDSSLQSSRLSQLILAIQEQGAQYVAPTLRGMRDEEYAQGYVTRRHLPNRSILLRQVRLPAGKCPFCQDRASAFLVELEYRGFILSQNLGPYDQLSLLLRPARLPGGGHNTQRETIDFLEAHGAQVLGDLPAGMTLFSNHLAGNSQDHLHLQLIGRSLPIAKLGDRKACPDLVWSPTGLAGAEYLLLGSGMHAAAGEPINHFSGCLLNGSSVGVVQAAVHYLKASVKSISDKYNFTAWREPADGSASIFIVMRRPDAGARDPSRKVFAVGAMAVSGLVVDESADVSEPLVYDDYLAELAMETLPPNPRVFPIPNC